MGPVPGHHQHLLVRQRRQRRDSSHNHRHPADQPDCWTRLASPARLPARELLGQRRRPSGTPRSPGAAATAPPTRVAPERDLDSLPRSASLTAPTGTRHRPRSAWGQSPRSASSPEARSPGPIPRAGRSPMSAPTTCSRTTARTSSRGASGSLQALWQGRRFRRPVGTLSDRFSSSRGALNLISKGWVAETAWLWGKSGSAANGCPLTPVAWRWENPHARFSAWGGVSRARSNNRTG